MPERKDVAGKDDEPRVRGRKGPPTQSRNEKKRRPAAPRGGANAARSVPKVGKRDPSRGDTSGDGLH